MPSCPLEVCSWGGDGTAPSPAERLPATAGDGLCVINLQANPPAVAARQIKELTHLCLKPAAKGSWEESRVGVGERVRERACVLLIDKKGSASSSERSRAPSKCRRRRRGKKKRFPFPYRRTPKSSCFQQKRWSLLWGPGQPWTGVEGEGIGGCRIAPARQMHEPGRWLLPLPKVGVWRGPLRFSVASLGGQGSAGALQRVRSASCFIFPCSTRKKRGENQHRLHRTLHVLMWGLANVFTTPLCFPVQGLGLQADDWATD